MDLFDSLENIIEETINKNNEEIKKINIKNDQGARPFDQEEFTIDRFEEDMVVLENRKTGEMIDVNKEDLPDNLKEGTILKKINGKYFIDEKLNQEISEKLEDKLKDFWN